ncbi:hypothetical protein EBH_0018900 [Eimeria brunetti]|uniref:SAG family member n=1 Tax=Eimeria brunetti TaxID=51314 RepID=U6LAP2_9EIME|nr:hypothetical protein EBH_0018900 [Eimeria brunetti]
MASFYKTAAALGLVALYGLQSGAADTTTYKFQAVDVDDDAYFAAKLVRNGKLPVHIGEIEKDTSLVSGLKEKVAPSAELEQPGRTSEESCKKVMEESGLKDIFHHAFPYKASPNYPGLFQEALDAGLTVFKDKGYQNKWNEIWEIDAGASLAYLLGSNSTKIGCVIGKCIQVQTPDDGSPTESATGDAFLFCQLSPAADKNKAPFE